MKKTVVLGITSGIAAYKCTGLIKLLRGKGVDIYVVMTKSAGLMFPPEEFEKASGHKIYTELFQKDFDYRNILKTKKVDHVELADRADVFVIAPATANIIAKIANGMADDFLTTTLLAATCPIIICPSMNVNMWYNPLVQQNLNRLKELGYQILEPGSGPLACGYEGKGRLPDISILENEIMEQLNRTTQLKGQKVIVTAGGTQEKIDEVRYITNRSSGKMGAALAEELYLRGADVLLLRAENAQNPRYQIKQESFTTADDLLKLIKKHVKNYYWIYHAAAVSDFAPEPQKGKIESRKSVTLKLKPVPKILNEIKKLNPKIHLVAFRAVYTMNGNWKKEALLKLKESKSYAILVNDVSKYDRGFEVDTNQVYVVLPNGKIKKTSHASKTVIARQIVETMMI